MKNYLKKYALKATLLSGMSLAFVAWNNDDDDVVAPARVNELEEFTDVILYFVNGSDTVEAHAQDKDGDGTEPLVILETPNLKASTTYKLSVEILNNLAEDDHDDDSTNTTKEKSVVKSEKKKTDAVGARIFGEEHDHEHGTDVTEEIKEEGTEHKFFFSFTEGAFTSPTGDGNIDSPSDAINYLDKDSLGLDLGLETEWTTKAEALSGGKFRIVLKHQDNGIKSASSSATDGETDFDLEFDLTITESTDKKVVVSAGQ